MLQKSLSPGPIEPSPGRRGWPKGTVMERAIQDLIKMVALRKFVLTHALHLGRFLVLLKCYLVAIKLLSQA